MIYKLTFPLQLALPFLGLLTRHTPPTPKLGSETDAAKIEVHVTGLRNTNGDVVISLFNKADGFPKMEKALTVKTVKISDKVAEAEFDGLTPGVYGIAVFHDENGNGKMDTNFFGIPKEGVGASNGAKGHFGPPKFADASFRLDLGTKTINITVVYL